MCVCRSPTRAPRALSLSKKSDPCTDRTPLTPDQLLDHLPDLPWYRNQVVHVERIPARPARHLAPATELRESTWRALERARGVQRGSLFLHQVCGRAFCPSLI